MFEFRIYSPATDETFINGRMLRREQVWETASFFMLNDSRWKYSPGVVLNVIAADKQGEYLESSTLDFFDANSSYSSIPVSVDIVEISPYTDM